MPQSPNENPAPEGAQPKRHSAAFWPLIVSLIIFCGILACCGFMLYRVMPAKDLYAAQGKELDHLQSEQARLEELLKLDPCEARSRLSSEASGALPAGTSSAPELAQKESPAPENAARALPARASAELSASPEEVEAGCVFIVSANGAQQIATGTGFFVDPAHVVTNRHVVSNAKGKILVTNKAMGAPGIGKIIATSDDDHDYALLEVSLPAGAQIKVLPFGAEPKKTQKVGAWGYPDLVGKNDPAYQQLMEGTNLQAVPELSYTEGVISAVLDRTPRTIVHTAPISPGNSGGPLVNSTGEVVGINTMITLDEDSYRQASLALAASDLTDFLKKNGINATIIK